jgi:cysteinyl-tRNA synthetase
MKKLYLYNSLSRKKEEFLPIKDSEVSLYTCGPTVYNFAHIGNLRSYVFADILKRVLKFNGYKVKHVMNITDVDDKTIRDSKIKYPDLDSMEALQKFTAEYEEYFWQDMNSLNVEKPEVITNALKYVLEMQELVEKIFKAGYAYVKEGSVYFDLAKYNKNNKYGQLIDLEITSLKAGARVDADEYEKENVQDFVLWKAKKDGEPSWDFELNGENLPGRPGWHIECSAMGEKELGCPFDIHTGGIDLKFPHHENEIAQSTAGYGAKEPVRFWMHNEHLLVDGQRMGKRFKNFYVIKDLREKDYNPLAYRYLTLLTHYRKTMNFTWEALTAAQNGLDHLFNQVRNLSSVALEVEKVDKEIFFNSNVYQDFVSSINDDLNTPEALAVVQEMLKSDMGANFKLFALLEFDKVLGLNLEKAIRDLALSQEVSDLVEKRKIARENKEWDESDRLRDEIESFGYIIEDSKDEMRVYKK